MKIGHYLKLLASETIKLLRSTKSKLTKDGNGENVPTFKNTKVVLVNCSNIVNNDFQLRFKSLVYVFP